MVKESGEPNEPVTHSFPYDLQPKGKRDIPTNFGDVQAS